MNAHITRREWLKTLGAVAALAVLNPTQLLNRPRPDPLQGLHALTVATRAQASAALTAANPLATHPSCSRCKYFCYRVDPGPLGEPYCQHSDFPTRAGWACDALELEV